MADTNASKKKSIETPNESDTNLGDLLQRKEYVQGYLNSDISFREAMLVLLIMPFVLVFMFLITPTGLSLYQSITNALNIQITPSAFYLSFFFIFLFLSSLPSLYFQVRASRRTRRLNQLEKEIEEAYLLSPSMRLRYLQKQLMFISAKSGRINWIDSKRRERSEKLRMEIGDMLATLEVIRKSEKTPTGLEAIPDWDDAQFRLTQWSELISDEERELRGERNWKLMSVGIALVYLVMIFYAIPLFGNEDGTNNIFGLPLPIVLWSGLGSFAAILYRFYKSPRRVNFEIEFRWLIARPIIGIIMGGLAYLALISGLLVFNITKPGDTPSLDLQKSGQLAQYWIVAFLAGFSDKFYEKIIEWLVGKITLGVEQEKEVNN